MTGDYITVVSVVGRMVAIAFAVLGLAFENVSELLFAIFLWLMMDSTDALDRRERRGLLRNTGS